MNKYNEMESEIQTLRERLSRLSTAVLRISCIETLHETLKDAAAGLAHTSAP